MKKTSWSNLRSFPFLGNTKSDVLDFSYDYTSFFTPNILDFLMNEDMVKPLRNVTVLAGLAVNTSPAPDYMFGNNKIRWGKNPAFLSNSIIEHLNYETGEN